MAGSRACGRYSDYCRCEGKTFGSRSPLILYAVHRITSPLIRTRFVAIVFPTPTSNHPFRFYYSWCHGWCQEKTRLNAKFRRRKDIPHPPDGILYIRISSQSLPAFPPSLFPPSAGGSRHTGRSPLPAPACAGSGCTGDRGSCCP